MPAKKKPRDEVSDSDEETEKKVSAPKTALYWITSKHNGCVISVNPDDESLNIWTKKKSPPSAYQLWRLGTNGHFVSSANGKVLDVDGASPEPGTQILCWEKLPGNRPNQCWVVEGDGHIKSKLGGLMLDIGNSKKDRGAGSGLILWHKRPHKWQLWTLEKGGEGPPDPDFCTPSSSSSSSSPSSKSSKPTKKAAKTEPEEKVDDKITLEAVVDAWDDVREGLVKRGKGSCGICFGDDSQVSVLSLNCTHTYCKECIGSTLTTALDMGSFPLRCPTCAADKKVAAERGLVTRSALKGLVKAKVIKVDLAQRVLLGQMRKVSDEANIDLAYSISKPCPSCSFLIVHYRGHGCHHIAPGKGCSNCGTHFCFVCLTGTGKTWTGCKNGCPPFCSAKCSHCALCTECKKGKPCDICDGCPSCKGKK